MLAKHGADKKFLSGVDLYSVFYNNKKILKLKPNLPMTRKMNHTKVFNLVVKPST